MCAKAATLAGLLCLSFMVGGAAGAAAPSTKTDTPVRDGAAIPAALRPVLYRALAHEAGPTYRISKDDCVKLSKQQLEGCFTAAGARFGNGSVTLALHLLAYGRGKRLTPVGTVQPAIVANRVSYAHGALTEWWRVLPLGFEQGFTIAKRPAGHGDLTLALAASHTLKTDHGTLALGKLRYGDLIVTDAAGKLVPSTLTTRNGHIRIAANDVGARYPLSVDPLVWLEQRVTASDGAANDNFGWAVALAGSTALVGAPQATVGTNGGQGAAYVFTESGGAWSQTAKLTASDGASSDNFGNSVALAGSTALVGAPNATVDGNGFQGAAYVFTEAGGTWTQTQKLIASDGEVGDHFGNSVALAGSTALVGAPNAAGGNPSQGAAYVFDESGGAWAQTAKLAASDGVPGDQFGNSVALAGSTALVGAHDATVGGRLAQGAAYVFDESGGTWTQTAKLTASDGATDNFFGSSVALTDSTALVGALGADIGGNTRQGAAYVFDESGGTWAQTVKLTASDGAAYNFFGSSVGLAGTMALAGAYGATVGGNGGQGAAYFKGSADLNLLTSAPDAVDNYSDYLAQTFTTNSGVTTSPAVTVTVAVPAAASFVSVTSTQGSCSEDAGLVTCQLGSVGSGGFAVVDVTLEATGGGGTIIDNTASVAHAAPPLSAGAPTLIDYICPNGYSEYDGTLAPNGRYLTPTYQAAAGYQTVLLGAPIDFQLHVHYRKDDNSRWIYRNPSGHIVYHHGPAGTYQWGVKAGADGGVYTLCIQHP